MNQRMARRPGKPEYKSLTHEFVATTRDKVLLQTVPMGKDVAKAHLQAALDVNASDRVRRHFAQVLNGYD